MLYVHVCKTLKVQVHVYMFVLSVCQDRNEVIGLRMQEIVDSLYALKGSYLLDGLYSIMTHMYACTCIVDVLSHPIN